MEETRVGKKEYFFIKDIVGRNEVQIKYCLKEYMPEVLFTKTLQVELFR